MMDSEKNKNNTNKNNSSNLTENILKDTKVGNVNSNI